MWYLYLAYVNAMASTSSHCVTVAISHPSCTSFLCINSIFSMCQLMEAWVLFILRYCELYHIELDMEMILPIHIEEGLLGH